MDGSHFDTFIRTFATTRLTRLQTLRGLAAASVAALTSITVASEEVGAKKNHEKKVKVCKCPDSTSANCRTAKVKKSQAKKQARKACNYKGACRSGVTSCATQAPNPGFQCTNNNDCTGGLVCIRQQCGNCSADTQCAGNTVCLSGTCRSASSPPGCIPNTQTCAAGCGLRINNCNQQVFCPCPSGQDCLPNGTCARPCTDLMGEECAGCTGLVTCSFNTSSEGPQYCLDITVSACENLPVCNLEAGTTSCPQGFACFPQCGLADDPRCQAIAVCPAS